MDKYLIKELDEFLGSRFLSCELEKFLISKRGTVDTVLYRGMNFPIHLIKKGNRLEEWHGSTHWSKDFQIAHNFAYDGYINDDYAEELQKELPEMIYKKYNVENAIGLFHPVIFRLKDNHYGIDVHSIIQSIPALEIWKNEKEVTFIGTNFTIESFEYVNSDEPYYLIDVKEEMS